MIDRSKVLFIGKGTFRILQKRASLPFDYDVVPLPFVSKRNIEGFREELRRALGTLDVKTKP